MIVYRDFEWDIREAARNLAAHGVSFKEASTVFADEGCTKIADGDARVRVIGRSERGRALVVTHQPGARIRILAAELHVPGRAQAQAPGRAEAKAARRGHAPAKDAGAKVRASKEAEPRSGSWRAAARSVGQMSAGSPPSERGA